MPENRVVVRVTLDIVWDAGDAWQAWPGEWKWSELLDLPDPEYVRMVDAVEVVAE